MRRVVKDLSIFVVDLESSAHLCLGTVNGGIKYYLLAGDKYTVATHSKKVEVSCPTFTSMQAKVLHIWNRMFFSVPWGGLVEDFSDFLEDVL
jgi:hypothetical protein